MENLLAKSKKFAPEAIKGVLPRKLRQDVKSSLKFLTLRYNLFNAEARSLPNFIIAGTQKGGTTALYSLLSQHPNILPAIVKEIHYFDWYYSRGLKWYRAHFPIIDSQPNRSNYQNAPYITGEASPYYMFHPLAFERIAKTVPEVRIILLLRDPVERAYSSYHQQRFMRREVHSFEEAIELEHVRLASETEKLLRETDYISYNHAHYSYLARGIYVEQIERCYKLFSKDQILIIESGSFFKQTSRIYAEILNFLMLPAHNIPNRYYSNTRKYEHMNANTRKRLINYFAPHNERLYDLIGERFDWPT